MKDGHGRTIDYLRISLTDRCNYRCIYCMPEEGVQSMCHTDILRIEEIAHVVRVFSNLGIKSVRLTGGEPLVRKGVVDLVRDINDMPGIKNISLTTNGALLPRLAPRLKDAGLDRVNISLDTLDPVQFGKITRLGRLEQTLAGIDAALAYGFSPVKVNCVVVRRLDQDVFNIARLSVDRPVHVRFIEYMPIGSDGERGFRAVDAAEASDGALRPEQWDASDTVPSAELREAIDRTGGAEGLGALEPVDDLHLPDGAGPARYWRFPGAAGTVGFISAMSNHFCSTCNRMRLTADGAIRPCLFSDAEYRVRDALRAGDDRRVVEIFHDAVAHKPQEHEVISGTERFMSQIGG